MVVNKNQISRYIRILVLWILCFQGFGIRILENVMDGAVVLWAFIILLFTFKNVIKVSFKLWIRFLFFILFYFIFCLIKDITPAYFMIVAWISAFFVLSNYWNNKNSFISDLYILTKICVIYSLLHIPIALIFSAYFIPVNWGNMDYQTFLYVFNYSGFSDITGIPRITGFAWEPSCWNILLNLNLVFILYFKKPFWYLILNIIAILFLVSTTGFITMLVIFLVYYILFSLKRVKNFVLGFLILLTILPFIFIEFQDKINTGSGATRLSDFNVAYAVLKQSPLLGGDLDNITSNHDAMMAKYNVWNVKEDISMYDSVGMTNAFASLFVEWGGVITIILLYSFFHTSLFNEYKIRYLIAITFIFVLMGTPIARTGFFYMFVFSGLFITRKERLYTSKNILI